MYCLHYVCMYATKCLVLREVKREHWILQNGSYRQCEPLCGGGELNSGLVEERTVLLSADPSFQAPKCFAIFF